MKITKILYLALAIIICFGSVSVMADSTDVLDTAYYQVIQSKIDNESATLDSKKNNGYYRGDDNNKYWAVEGGTGYVTGYFGNDNQVTNKAMGGSGEFVFQYKTMFNAGGHYLSSNVYCDKDDSNNFMGFDFNASHSNGVMSANIQFYHRINATDNVKFDLEDGLWTFNPNHWYTLKHVYNLDTKPKTAKLYIYDETGDEVKSLSYDLPETLIINGNSHTIFYNDLRFCYLRVGAAKNGGSIAIDDFSVSKTVCKPVVVNYDKSEVSVISRSTEVEPGVENPIEYNSSESVAYYIAPKGEFEVKRVLVNGVVTDGTESVTLASVTEDTVIEVESASKLYTTFEKQTNSSLAEGKKNNNEYIESDGLNKYWTVFSEGSGKSRSGYFGNEASEISANSKILGSAGEYIVQHKTRFSNELVAEGAAGYYKTHTILYYRPSSTDNPNSFMGFTVHPSGKKGSDLTASVGFQYRYRPDPAKSSDVEPAVTLGTMTISPDKWYVFKHVYNLDTNPKVATLYVYDENGALIKSFEHILTDAVKYNDVTCDVSAGEISFQSVRCDVNNSGKIELDDVLIGKTTKKVLSAEYSADMGSVKLNGVELCDSVLVDYNSSSANIIGITPADGYEISDVKLNGESKGNLISSFELKNIVEDTAISVEFKEKTAVAPALDASVTPEFVYNAEKGYHTAFFEINPGYGYTFTGGLAKLYKAGDPETSSAPFILAIADDNNFANEDGWNGKYGVRVYGNWFTPGDQYILVPYWTASDEQGTDIVIDPASENGDMTKYTFEYGASK